MEAVRERKERKMEEREREREGERVIEHSHYMNCCAHTALHGSCHCIIGELVWPTKTQCVVPSN